MQTIFGGGGREWNFLQPVDPIDHEVHPPRTTSKRAGKEQPRSTRREYGKAGELCKAIEAKDWAIAHTLVRPTENPMSRKETRAAHA